MQVPEAQTRMLHHVRSHCHQICPNKLWSPRISSRPALPASLLPYDGSASRAVWARPRLWRGPQSPAWPPGGRRLLRTEDHSPQPPPPQPRSNGRAAKAASAGRWRLLSVTAALLAAAPAVHGGQCALLGTLLGIEGDPLSQGSPQEAAACCFLPPFGSLPLRRNGIWREGGKEEREGKGRREGCKRTGHA